MFFACWVSKATRPCVYVQAHTNSKLAAHPHARIHTHTQKFVILIAFAQQQWFRERASVLRYTSVACLVSASMFFVTPKDADTRYRSWLKHCVTSLKVEKV
jgi:hypothetical protein